MPGLARSNSSDRAKKPVMASVTCLRCRGVCTLLGNRPLPQMAICSLVQVSWLPSFLLTRLPMGTPQWPCERSYSAQLREQRPNGTSLDQRGGVKKRKKHYFYTKDHTACQGWLPKSAKEKTKVNECCKGAGKSMLNLIINDIVFVSFGAWPI